MLIFEINNSADVKINAECQFKKKLIKIYLTAFCFPKIYGASLISSAKICSCSIPKSLMAATIMSSGETQHLGSLVVSPCMAANDINDLTLGLPRRSGGLFALLLPASSLARFPAAPSAPSEHHIRDRQRSTPPKLLLTFIQMPFWEAASRMLQIVLLLLGAPPWEPCRASSHIFFKNEKKKKENQRESFEKNPLQVPPGFLIIPYDSPNLHGHILKLVADLLCRRCCPCSAEGSNWKCSQLFFLSLSWSQSKGKPPELKG